ncbi:signal peptidase I, partial [bacterium]|nr:signal peptidase I [bacterium]
MNFDFATILVLLTFLSGIIWLIDSLFFAAKRQGRATVTGTTKESSARLEKPLIVDYARSFFPIFLFVLILRSF